MRLNEYRMRNVPRRRNDISNRYVLTWMLALVLAGIAFVAVLKVREEIRLAEQRAAEMEK